MSLFGYIKNEVTRSYLLDHDHERYKLKREKMYTFMRIPWELEKFMSYGFFHCLDSFLFVYTFLPLRVTLAVVSLIIRPILIYFGHFRVKKGRTILPAEIIDMMKVFMILSCCYAMSYVDTSMLYHIIKSQSVIKLYLMYNMIEVADRLFSAFGQDTIDALFWTATEPRDRKREHIGLIPHLLLALFYVFLHGLLVLLQATTLNVAINSSNKALLTIMMSNNFVELKGSVFKKFDKNNLFQVSCSDVRERFHLFALLLVVVLQTMKEYGWKEESFWSLAPDCLTVLGAEVLVDWLKHAFITRFNEVSADVYKDYTISLAYDLAQTKQKLAFSDHSDIVSRRMGFIPLPLGVVMLRVLYSSVKSTNPGAVLVFVMAYVCLFTFRVLCSVVILGKACDLIEGHKVKQRTKSFEDLMKSDERSKQDSPFNFGSSKKYETPSPMKSFNSAGNSKVMDLKSVPFDKELPKSKSELNASLSLPPINDFYQCKSTENIKNVAKESVNTLEKDGLETKTKSSSEKVISTMSMNLGLHSASTLTKSLSSPDLIRPEADFDEEFEVEEESSIEGTPIETVLKRRRVPVSQPPPDIKEMSTAQPPKVQLETSITSQQSNLPLVDPNITTGFSLNHTMLGSSGITQPNSVLFDNTTSFPLSQNSQQIPYTSFGTDAGLYTAVTSTPSGSGGTTKHDLNLSCDS